MINLDNEVTLEEDDEEPRSDLDDHGKDVYVGGPAALFSAALQARSGQDAGRVVYCHDGARATSNWKGSASYFNVMASMPYYYWPGGHGANVLWATAVHTMRRWFDPQGYKKQVESDPTWNVLRINFAAVIKEPSTIWLFVRNAFNAWKDVGLNKKFEGPTEDQTSWTTINHAFLSQRIIEKLRPPLPVIMKSDLCSSASLHVDLANSDKGKANKVLKHLAKVAGEATRHRKLGKEEVIARGYPPQTVKQAVEFPHDGYIPPYVDGMLEDLVTGEGGDVKSATEEDPGGTQRR